MNSRRTPVAQAAVVLFAAVTLLALTCCTKKSDAETPTVEIHLDLKTPFRFVAYGDTRFHDPSMPLPRLIRLSFASPGTSYTTGTM